ncbi:LPS translocon maturation chaperone LptM [Candidiatus Paracoxiella cheracis]|uniref:LPS translocon maturation chaperone LptM n=1 Tax=Candidiatus Paracoxiella cheracis TaxID=3405120 RepID=UPI003BF57B58
MDASFMKKLIIALPIFCLLTACGQTGGLYLPPHAKPTQHQANNAKKSKNVQQR